MKSTILLFFVALIFFGCSYRHDDLYIGNKKTTEQGVANTKKSQIFQNGKVKIFVVVTYLDSLDRKEFVDKNREQFIVGFYFVNLKEDVHGEDIGVGDVEFKIDGKSDGVMVRKLKVNNPILKIVPASNPWSQYFLIQTPRIDKNVIKLSLKLLNHKEITFDFEKNF